MRDTKTMESERREQIIKAVLDTAFRIHTTLGPGLLESLYETILSTELRKQGLRVENQKTVEFEYNGTPIGMNCGWIYWWRTR